MIAALTEPTSDKIAPGERYGAMSFATSPIMPAGTQRMTRSAPSAAAAAVSATSSASASSFTFARTVAEISEAMILRASPLRRHTRAREEPISPMPMRARRSNNGSLKGAPRRSGTRAALESNKVLEGLDDEMVGFPGANGEPQAMGQPIGANRAQNQSAG